MLKLIPTLILAIHLAWIVLVIVGAVWTRGRPFLTALHILSLLWGIVVEVSPWPCPLTLAEQHFETLAGEYPYHGSFLLHYLDAIVYPNLPYWVVTAAGVTVCAVNLAVYGWRLWAWLHRPAAHGAS